TSPPHFRSFFCFTHPAPTQTYTFSLHDALPISIKNTAGMVFRVEPMHKHVVEEVKPALITLMGAVIFLLLIACSNVANHQRDQRSEEHTSELQSRSDLVCRLLLEKKKKKKRTHK